MLSPRVRNFLIVFQSGAGLALTASGILDLMPRWWSIIPGVALMLASFWFVRLEIVQGVLWLRRYTSVMLVILVLFLTGSVMWEDITVGWDSFQASREESRQARSAALDKLRTRPVCTQVCDKKDIVVTRCMSETVSHYARGVLVDAGRATGHFRSCLKLNGLDWELCKSGDARCYRPSVIPRPTNGLQARSQRFSFGREGPMLVWTQQ